uniref:Uncharacterized protein n=1 Tax=Lepeophtheirus salmonis TaxID=72036 RepID=A0A0K2UZE1_LEPSM
MPLLGYTPKLNDDGSLFQVKPTSIKLVYIMCILVMATVI